MLHAALGVTVCFVTLHLALADICPKQNKTVIPQFTEELAVSDMVRWGRSIAVRCCAEGYDNIRWYRKEASDWVHFPPVDKSSSITPKLEEKQQILRIYEADASDNTYFRCDLIKDGVSRKQHEMRLIVQRCDKISRGPIPTEPSPQNKTIKNFGENVTLYCTGYFGCGSDVSRMADWLVVGEHRDITSISNRYVIHQFSRNDWTTIGSILTIYNVQPEDLKQTFLCRLSSAQIINGIISQAVHISKAAVPTKVSTLKIILITGGGVIGLVVLILLNVCVIKVYYGPQVTLFVKSHLPRIKSAPRRGEKRYNALIYHADGDESTAASIKDKLRMKGYDIFISDDLGRNLQFGTYESISDQSLNIMFLHSKNLQADQWAHVLLQSLIMSGRAQDIIFLVVDKYDPEQVMESTAHANHPERDKNLSDKNDASQNTGSQSKDLKFWKALPRCHVPQENASVRKKNNFLCWLQNKLPKFQDQLQKPVTEKSKRRTSSGRQLLASQAEESVAPMISGIIIEDDPVFLEGQSDADDNLGSSRQNRGHFENEITDSRQMEDAEDVLVAVVHTMNDDTSPKSIDTLESGVGNSINNRTVDSFSQSESFDDKTRNGSLECSLKLSQRQSSRESGYGTSSDQNFSPQLQGNSVYLN